MIIVAVVLGLLFTVIGVDVPAIPVVIAFVLGAVASEVYLMRYPNREQIVMSSEMQEYVDELDEDDEDGDDVITESQEESENPLVTLIKLQQDIAVAHCAALQGKPHEKLDKIGRENLPLFYQLIANGITSYLSRESGIETTGGTMLTHLTDDIIERRGSRLARLGDVEIPEWIERDGIRYDYLGVLDASDMSDAVVSVITESYNALTDVILSEKLHFRCHPVESDDDTTGTTCEPVTAAAEAAAE